MKVVCNSTPLISLSSINKLNLLRDLFGEIIIPEKVFDEVVIAGSEKYGSSDVKECKWIKVSKTSDNILKNYLMQTHDEGESEVIALADEINAECSYPLGVGCERPQAWSLFILLYRKH